MDTVGGKRQGLTGPSFMRASRALISTAISQVAVSGRSSPATEDAVPKTVHSQAARGQTSPRRYVGRTSSGPQRPAPPVRPGAPETGGPKPTEAPARHAGSWSIRLIITVALVSLLGVGLRITGITTAPVDVPAGVESTQAAVVSLLTGQTTGAP